MIGAGELAFDAAEREWDAMTDDERAQAAHIARAEAQADAWVERNPAAHPKCPLCHGSGVVYDSVDYGSTTVQMPSMCECVDDDDQGADDAPKF